MAEGIMGLMDSMPDEGPPADAGDTSSPNFGQGMSIPQMYEILMPLARMVAEQTGEPVQAILQEMVTDPTAIGRAKSMLGMDETTPFPNNIREPMPSEMLMPGKTIQGIPKDLFDSLSTEQQASILGASAIAGMSAPSFASETVKGIPKDLFDSLSTEQQASILGSSGLAGLLGTPQTQGIPRTIFEQLNDEEQAKILGMGDTFTNIDLPQGRPTMSERLLSQMSLKD